MRGQLKDARRGAQESEGVAAYGKSVAEYAGARNLNAKDVTTSLDLGAVFAGDDHQKAIDTALSIAKAHGYTPEAAQPGALPEDLAAMVESADLSEEGAAKLAAQRLEQTDAQTAALQQQQEHESFKRSVVEGEDTYKARAAKALAKYGAKTWKQMEPAVRKHMAKTAAGDQSYNDPKMWGALFDLGMKEELSVRNAKTRKRPAKKSLSPRRSQGSGSSGKTVSSKDKLYDSHTI